MKISLIVAMASNRVIGVNGKMPWHLPADLKRFKQITWGAPILMGRKTFEAIGKPLPGRSNIIISSNPDYLVSGCQTASSIADALHLCQSNLEVFVIGGATLYESLLPNADFLYLTRINKDFAGDTYFPEIVAEEWLEVENEAINNDTNVDFNYSFSKLKRNPPPDRL
ncbi:dihydrofolate reductase [Methylomonas paludis]|uniref:Dihydrofolate reductase n=1 Tax=Methylomonas paludis TaxID=1173101 RepID=A0A975MNM5_9GAMM|nr:dihydrofolate reductase [Methylomonas paludis]QWF71191.1 dihydrofolate reductase [Methylomonas paludis]